MSSRKKNRQVCFHICKREKRKSIDSRIQMCLFSFFPLRTNFRSEREKRKKRTKTIFFFSFAGCASFFFLGSLCFVTSSSSSFWLLSLPQWISSKAHSGGNEGSHAGGIGLFPMEIAFLNLEENINSIRLPKILQPCERGKTTHTRPVTIVGAVTHSKQILAQ